MQCRKFVLVAMSLSLAAVANAASTSIPPVNQPVAGPQAALERLADAFRDRSASGVVATFSGDYRFHSSGDSLLVYVNGTSRDEEARTWRSVFEGVTRDGVTLVQPADSVGCIVDGVGQSLDPEHPDSTQHFRVITVKRFELRIRRPDGQTLETPFGTHVFHVVRGDAAVLAEGQSADPDRWYIRRWLEDVTGVRKALGERKGDCGEQEPMAESAATPALAGAPAIPMTLGIRALTNPACAALRVSCDLPGAEPAKLEVYDVSGRLVNTRQLAVKAAGTVAVDAGAGARLLPGVYWVRLGQATRRPSTQMVVVAR